MRAEVPAGVTSGSLTFSNNLKRVRMIRKDGKIAAADPTFAGCQGTMTVRFDGQTLVNEAMNGSSTVALEYSFTFADGPLSGEETLIAFHDVPAEHGKHIRTANPIESPFASVRLTKPRLAQSPERH